MAELRALDNADFSGGINAVANPYKVSKKQVLRALNFLLDEDGSLTVRDGSKTVSIGPEGTSKVLSLFSFIKEDFSLIPLAIARVNGSQALYKQDNEPWDLLGTFGTLYDTPTMLAWLNQVFIAAGYEIPWKWLDTPLTTPVAPVVTPVGTAGVTTYTYIIVARNSFGTTAHSPDGTTATGNAVLSTTNYNALTWTRVQNAIGYDVYRTVGGATQGLIASTVLAAVHDTGLPGDGSTAPVVNTTTGFAQLSGAPLSAPTGVTVVPSDKPLAIPAAPVITNGGTAGATTYSYVIVALNDLGSTPHSPTGTTATGNATLSTTNYNLISWTAVPDAVKYNVYRTAGGGSQGFLGEALNGSTSLVDIGTVADGTTAPTVDTTTGTTTYTYVVTAINNNGETLGSTPGTTTKGNATLSTTAYNTVKWLPVPLATGYKVYRTVGGPTQGLLGTVTITTINDTGLSADGTAVNDSNTTASVIPGAEWLTLHQSALWAWNTAAVSKDFDGPSSLRQSDINRPDSWPESFQLFINKDDGQHGTGMGVFTIAQTGISPTSVLILFKEYSTYQVEGLFGFKDLLLTLPTITKVQTDMGCVGGRTVQFLPGYGLIRLTHKGFGLFNGLNDLPISEAIRPYLFGDEELDGIAWGNANLSTAAQTQDPPLYICACPMDAQNQRTRVFIFDLVHQGWTVCTFPMPFATLNLLFSPTHAPVVNAGAANGGNVLQLFQGEDTDDGTSVPWMVRFPPFAGLLRKVYIRRCLVKLFHVRPFQTLKAVFLLGPAQSPQIVTQTATLPVGAIGFPGSGFPQSVEADALFDVGRTGDGCTLELSGAGKIGIRGLTYHVRALPLTRPMRV